MKHKGYHPKKAILVKPSHLDHLFEMVTTFKQTKGHELGVKKTMETNSRGSDPTTKCISVDKGVNPFEVGET